MAGKYGQSTFRQDPSPVLETQVTGIVRQTQTQRVLETVASVTPAICSVYSTAGSPLSLVIGAPANIPFNAELVDSNSMHDNAVNNDRITVAAADAGVYRITARVQFGNIVGDDGTGITELRVRVMVNSVAVKTESTNPATDGTHVLMIDHQQQVNAGGIITIEARALGTDSGQVVSGGSPDITYCTVVKQF